MNLKTRERVRHEYCIPQTKPTVGSQCNTQAGDMNTLMMPPAYCLSNVEIVGSFLYVFQSSVLFSARATSQEVMFTSLTEN